MRAVAITILFSFLSAFQSYGQEKQLKFSQSVLFDHGFKTRNIVIPQENYHNGFTSVRRYVELERYDESGKKVATGNLMPKHLSKGYSLLSTINSGEKVFGIYSYLKKKESKRVTYKQEFNLKTLRPLGGPVEIGRNSQAKGGGIFKEYDHVIRSKKGSKFAVINYPSNPLDADHKMNVQIFDSNCEMIASHKVEYDFVEKLSKRVTLEIDEQGNIYELRKVFKNKKDLGKDENFDLKLYRIDLSGDNSSHLHSKGNFIIGDVKIWMTKERVYMANLFDSSNDAEIRSVGIDVVTLEKRTMELIASSTKEYLSSFLTKNYSDEVKVRTEENFNANKKVAMGNLKMLDLQYFKQFWFWRVAKLFTSG